jgi:hypothetical protein
MAYTRKPPFYFPQVLRCALLSLGNVEAQATKDLPLDLIQQLQKQSLAVHYFHRFGVLSRLSRSQSQPGTGK